MNYKNKIIYFSGVLIAFFFAYLSPSAQSGIDEIVLENQSQKGVEKYKQENYKQALYIFENLFRIRYEYPSKDIVHLMYGKTLYKLGRYEQAKKVQKDFLLMYPDNTLTDYARHNLGEIYYRLGEFPKATREFLSVAVNAKSAPLRSKGLTLAGYILENKITLDDIRKQRNETLNIIEKAFLTLKLSENLYLRGAGGLAKKEAKSFLAEFRNPPFKEEIKRISKGKFRETEGAVNIGVLLPLTGEYAENGLNLLRGIKTAFNEQPEEVKKKVKLTIIDNESDQVKTVELMLKLSNDPSILAVIGPMMSDNATAASAIANSRNLPMISPTATKDGIAGLGFYSFQSNSDLTVKGRSLAKYAIDSLSLRRIAILSPANDYGKQMTDSFALEIDALGGEIVAQSWYYGEPKNLRLQFNEFRRIGFRIHEELYPTEEPPDSFDILTDTTLTDSVKMEMLTALSKPMEEIDSGKVVLDVIDGFYLPIEFGEIKYIAPQFAFWNFKTQILGGQNWYDEEILMDKAIARYLDGAIFSSDIYRGVDNEALEELRKKYQKTFGEDPYRTDIFGYDCLNLVLHLIKNNVRTRELFIRRLNRINDFNGVAGLIDFTGESQRVNNYVHILKFVDKNIIKIN
ncbi:MAG: penicillin-binding protein activator [Candidatus Marinimicrobia bacterium]|nr:penicillin-binding protein activator [Candidatus Neomarinimicrobiota bacterium]